MGQMFFRHSLFYDIFSYEQIRYLAHPSICNYVNYFSVMKTLDKSKNNSQVHSAQCRIAPMVPLLKVFLRC